MKIYNTVNEEWETVVDEEAESNVRMYLEEVEGFGQFESQELVDDGEYYDSFIDGWELTFGRSKKEFALVDESGNIKVKFRLTK